MFYNGCAFPICPNIFIGYVIFYRVWASTSGFGIDVVLWDPPMPEVGQAEADPLPPAQKLEMNTPLPSQAEQANSKQQYRDTLAGL